LNLHVGPANYCLHADPVRIEQIVWNLLSNALKFSPDGSTISVKLAAIEIDIAEVWLEVTDTGQGIDPRSLPLVFEMFQQADAHPTTRRKSGLGIGLAIVKRLVEAHGGQVDATSEGAGRGATFTVVLPRRSGPLPEGIQDAKASTLRGARILLVEDELQTLETFRSVLESAGAVLTTASSGEEALAKAAPGLFDLIVSDIAMPGMDGYALLARLREAGLRDVPALAVTGFARPADRKRALAAGFNEHLGKPLELEALLGAIEHLHPRGFA
jgi:two-component system CheB/CheR fusion protein